MAEHAFVVEAEFRERIRDVVFHGVDADPELFGDPRIGHAVPDKLNDARLRMADTPEGAELIMNPVTGAPGVRIGNVFVMAGVPGIFQGMLTAIETALERGVQIHSRAVTALGLPESRLAEQLLAIQNAIGGVAIGSYPIDGDEKGVTIVARAQDPATADAAILRVSEAMRALGAEPLTGERPGR